MYIGYCKSDRTLLVLHWVGRFGFYLYNFTTLSILISCHSAHYEPHGYKYNHMHSDNYTDSSFDTPTQHFKAICSTLNAGKQRPPIQFNCNRWAEISANIYIGKSW